MMLPFNFYPNMLFRFVLDLKLNMMISRASASKANAIYIDADYHSHIFNIFFFVILLERAQNSALYDAKK